MVSADHSTRVYLLNPFEPVQVLNITFEVRYHETIHFRLKKFKILIRISLSLIAYIIRELNNVDSTSNEIIPIQYIFIFWGYFIMTVFYVL